MNRDSFSNLLGAKRQPRFYRTDRCSKPQPTMQKKKLLSPALSSLPSEEREKRSASFCAPNSDSRKGSQKFSLSLPEDGRGRTFDSATKRRRNSPAICRQNFGMRS